MTIVNQKRIAAGVAPHPIYDDAYEAINEDEL
jgi:hypothetical protein